MRLDEHDKKILRTLDKEFIIDNETATVAGEMEIEIVRPSDDRLHMTIRFPNNETLEIRMARAQLSQERNIEVDKS